MKINHSLQLLLIGTILTLSLTVQAGPGLVNKAFDPTALSMKNPNTPTPTLITGGQPSKADLQLLAANGVTAVINLRTEGEFDGYDEAAEAKRLGLGYHLLEISAKTGINSQNALLLDKLISTSDGKTLIHCASSNRVGALLAIRAYAIKGKTAEQAVALGKKAGLTRLSAKVDHVIQTITR